MRESYAIISRNPVVIFLWKNTTGWPVEFVSENVKQVFGYTSEELISGEISYSEIIHPDDLDRVVKEVAAYSEEKTKKEFNKEYRIVTKQGKVKWVDDRTYIRRDEKGMITYYQGTILDITKRKKTEEQIREQSEFLQKIIESLAHPFYVIDVNDYTIKMANRAAASAKTLTEGVTCYALTHHSDKPCESPEHLCSLIEVKKTKKPITVEHVHYNKLGDEEAMKRKNKDK